MKNKSLKTLIFATAFGVVSHAAAQTVQPSDSDTLVSVKLEDVVVSSLKVDKKIADAPISIAIVNSIQLKKHAPFTVADGLKDEPGIAKGGDGVWSTNINIRGLGEDRIVTLVDGNRIETSTDLTASLSMIDVNDIERIEVVKGAQSVLYGSGAIGGIVNVITKDGHFSDDGPYASGYAFIGFASVNRSSNQYINITTGGEKWYLKVNAGHGLAHDVKTPQGTINNSGYETNDIALRLGFKPTDNHIIKLNFQNNWSTDVGIPGGSAFPQTGEAKYKNIRRTLFNANYEITDLTRTFTSLKITGFVQNIIRDVEMIPNQVSIKILPNNNIQKTAPQLITPQGKHLAFGGQVQGRWDFGNTNTLITGIDVWQRQINSTRNKYITVTIEDTLGNILKTNYIERGESPLPNASFTSAGVFLQDEMRFFNNRLKVTIGGRLDGIFVKNDECHDVDYIILNNVKNDRPDGQKITFEAGEKQDISWSANVGAIFNITRNLDLVFNAAHSFRSPSLEERFKYIDLTSKVRLGNPDLKPEDGVSADIGFRLWGDNVNANISGFITNINNMIVEREGIFVYQTIDGITDTLPALVLDNVSQAIIYGLDFSVNYNIFKGFEAFASGSYILGTEIKNNTYLPNIPPISGHLGVSYTYPKVGSISMSLTAVGEKKQVAAGEKTTAAYARLDMTLNSKLFKFSHYGFQVLGGIDNITNETYTNFFSTNRSDINYEPGRNFFIKLLFQI